jgi:hypothetical protein
MRYGRRPGTAPTRPRHLTKQNRSESAPCHHGEAPNNIAQIECSAEVRA